MAEIKIEKKKPIWPWVLITLIILAAIAYFIYANNDADDTTDDMTSDDIDDVSMNRDTGDDTIAYEEAMDVLNPTSPRMAYS